jgi:tetratricopeptide (TPR) repeat protein
MQSRRNWLFALALLVATILVYSPAWNGQPIWDDEIHITRPELRSLHGLARIWTDPSATPQYYPVMHTLFWVEYRIWDGWVLPYHLFTICCHALLALLVVLVLRRLKVPGAWIAGFVFALHPVHVESVAWFSEVKNTLSGVLAAAALLAYLKYDQHRYRWAYFLALALFAIGLLTKTAIVALPAVVLIILWWKRGSLAWRHDVRPLVPFFAVGLAASAITIWVEQKFCAEHGEVFAFSWLDRCLVAGRLFWFYLGNIFWPANLSLIYPPWSIDSSQVWQYLFAFGAVAMGIGFWLLRGKSRAPLAALLCFVALLFPILGFFNLSFFMTSAAGAPHSAICRADHFQYLADIPIIALVCACLAQFSISLSGTVRSGLSGVAVLVVALLAFGSFARSGTFRDAESCFRDVLSKNPVSATAHNNLANVLRQQGKPEEAVLEYGRALELDPNYQLGRYNLGATLVQKGDPKSAIPLLEQALQSDPNNPKAYYSLGTALEQTSRPEEAIAAYSRAVRLQPAFLDAHTNLANLLLAHGDREEAMLHYRKAVELDPGNPMTRYNLAVGFARTGHTAEAIAELQTVLRIDPSYPDAASLLRDLLAQTGR